MMRYRPEWKQRFLDLIGFIPLRRDDMGATEPKTPPTRSQRLDEATKVLANSRIIRRFDDHWDYPTSAEIALILRALADAGHIAGVKGSKP